MMKLLGIFAASILAVTITGCEALGGESMTFKAEDGRLVATGTIDGSTLKRFERARLQNPDITTLVLQNVGGSSDDDANLKLSRQVRALGFDTVVPADGLVASGGTDLFLAGNDRTLEPGACVGVHSWAYAGGGDGRDLPRSDPEHKLYTDYYTAIDIDPAFYWFTLDAAAAEDMHWMTRVETQAYAMTTSPIGGRLGQGEACDFR